MFTLLSKNENAVIVLHEIYGLNNHIKQVCKELHNSGLDVYCPNFLNREEPFSYDQHSQAYDYFMKFCGFDTSMIFDLLTRIRDRYKKNNNRRIQCWRNISMALFGECTMRWYRQFLRKPYT